MFGTFRCSGDDNGLVQTSHKPFPYPEEQTKPRSACLNCRHKKLKCMGDRSGCLRCIAKKINCTYPPSNYNKSANKSQSSDQTSPPNSSPTSKGRGDDIGSDGVMDWQENRLSGGEEESKSGGSPPVLSTASPSPPLVGSASCEERDGTVDWNNMMGESAGQIDMACFGFGFGNVDVGNTDLGDGFVDEEGLFDFVWDARESPNGLFSIFDVQVPQTTDTAVVLGPDIPGPHQKLTAVPQPLLKFPGTTSFGSDDSACHCIHNLLHMNERLEITQNGSVESSFDQTLSQNKRFISQCQVMIACGRCSKNSALVMLMVSICEKLIASFKNLVNQHPEVILDTASQTKSLDESIRKPAVGIERGRQTDLTQRISLGDYNLDTIEESSSVLNVLTEIQIKSFQCLLSNLDSLMTLHNWASHQAKLDTIKLQLRIISKAMQAVRIQPS